MRNQEDELRESRQKKNEKTSKRKGGGRAKIQVGKDIFKKNRGGGSLDGESSKKGKERKNKKSTLWITCVCVCVCVYFFLMNLYS